MLERRSYLLEHDEAGTTIGVVLNHPMTGE
jgi:putative AlgH/UPF0301 family transcriptional regulator